MLVQDWASKWAMYSPNRIALKEYETGRTLKYAELNYLGNRLARELDESWKIQKGDRIAVLSEYCLEYVILFVAAQKTGVILVPINYRLASAEIEYLLQNARPKLVVVAEKFQALLKSKSSDLQSFPLCWNMEAVRQFCDTNRAIFPESNPTVANNKSLQTFYSSPFKMQAIDENDPIFILYTSGTTGFPKGALYTHKMLFWNSINTAMSLIINTESRTINCMPPFHTGGWNVLLTPLLHHGGYSCLMKKFDAATILKLIEREKATIFMGVPTMLKMIADLPEFEDADFSSLLYIIVGGEPMPIPLIEKWHNKGVPIRQGFGMTEVGPNLTSLHQGDAVRKKGSIGKPNFYVGIKIVDKKGKEVPSGTAGELLLSGPMVTPGYWNNEAATAQAIQQAWFHSGDMVYQDEEGYLYVVDRIKNMYISGGENVYPAEVERVLLKHSAVSEVAVIGIPDKQWGEAGKAFIVKKEGHFSSEKAIRDFCKTQLAKFKIPKIIVFLASLPKGDTGKIDRKKLISKS